MLYAYIDESGHEQEEDWMTVAGFVGSQKQWDDALPLWRDAIKPRKSLHMQKLRFQKERDKRLLERVGQVPDKAGLKPALAAVRVADYKDIVEGTFHERRLKGYMICCYGLVIQTLRGIPKGERLGVTFEDQKEYSTMASMAMRAVAESPDPMLLTDAGVNKLANWSFVPKGSTALLELADCFAYAANQVRRDRTSRRAVWSSPILKTNGGDAWGLDIERPLARVLATVLGSDIDPAIVERLAQLGLFRNI